MPQIELGYTPAPVEAFGDRVMRMRRENRYGLLDVLKPPDPVTGDWESFAVPRAWRGGLDAAISRRRKANPKVNFTTRREGEMVRVWRVS